jgi:glucose-1-phosphate adenylyltransferase
MEQQLARETLVIILGGGQGERLYPLTRDRAKPAVPFGGSYRIIDFALSNCVNSGLRRIYILTQYKSISLDRHLRLTWNAFDEGLGEYIVPIPPQQRIGERWYLGTADAIYQNIYTLEQERPKYVIVLAGDHVYKMNYLDMLMFHLEKGADATVACVEVPVADGKRFGVVAVDTNLRIRGFDEKPPNPKPLPDRPDLCLASMGIYIFETRALVQMITEDAKRDSTHDFGRDILPRVMNDRPVFAYPFKDENRKAVKYWRDIGTLDAYYQANMDLVAVDPVFNLYGDGWPIRTYLKQLPPAKFVFDERGGRAGMAVNSIVSNGCIIAGGRVSQSVLSSGVRVEEYAEVDESILMDFVTVCAGARVRRAIIDKNVTIPAGARVGYDLAADRKKFVVTDSGIVVIPKGVPRTQEFWRA